MKSQMSIEQLRSDMLPANNRDLGHTRVLGTSREAGTRLAETIISNANKSILIHIKEIESNARAEADRDGNA